MNQLIWNGCDGCEIAEKCEGAELPDFPVQDAGGRWHYEEFDGQMVVFSKQDVHFGFLAVKVEDNYVPKDEDGEPDYEGLFVIPNGDVFEAI